MKAKIPILMDKNNMALSYLFIAVKSEKLKEKIFKHYDSYIDSLNPIINKVEIFHIYGQTPTEMVENIKNKKDQFESMQNRNAVDQEKYEKLKRLFDVVIDNRLVKKAMPESVRNYCWSYGATDENSIFLYGYELPEAKFFIE